MSSLHRDIKVVVSFKGKKKIYTTNKLSINYKFFILNYFHIYVLFLNFNHKAYLTQRHCSAVLGPDYLRLLSTDWLQGYCCTPWKHRIFDNFPAKNRGNGEEGGLLLTTLRSPKWPSENKKEENLLKEKGQGEPMGLNLSQLFKKGSFLIKSSGSWSWLVTSTFDLMKNSESAERSWEL